MSNDLYISVEQLRLGLVRVEGSLSQLITRLGALEQHVGIATSAPLPPLPAKPVPTGPPSAVPPSPPQPLTAQPISSANPLATLVQGYLADFLGQAAPVVQAFLAHSQGHPVGTVGPAGAPHAPPGMLPSGARNTVKLPPSFPSMPPPPPAVPPAQPPAAHPAAASVTPAAAAVGAGELDWMAAEGVPTGQVAAAVRTTAVPAGYQRPPGVGAAPDPSLLVPMPR